MFNSNDSNSNEQQSLNSLTSTSPTVLDDHETSTLRSLPTDANMTIINDDKEGSIARSVDSMPAGNLTLFNSNDNDDDTVYRSLSISTQPTLRMAPSIYNNDLGNEGSLLKGKGPTMEPFETIGISSYMKQEVPDFNSMKVTSMDVDDDEDDQFTFDNSAANNTSTEQILPDDAGAPVKPSFIPYCGDHFDYSGDVALFRNKLSQAAIECGADLQYNATRFEYTVLAYPSDEKIEYGIQIYRVPNTNNGHVIEFRRLSGPVFVYRNHIMSVWTSLKKYSIGPGVPSNAKPMMPNLNMECVDKDGDYKVQAETLKPMLKMVSSRLLDVSCTGLQMLISATKAPATQDALKETKAVTTVINIASASENTEIDRCAAAVLREAINKHHEEIISAKGDELILEKIGKSLQQNIDLSNEILEVQRNYLGALKNLCLCNNKSYLNLLKQKGAHIVVRRIVKSSTKCARLQKIAQDVATLLKPI